MKHKLQLPTVINGVLGFYIWPAFSYFIGLSLKKHNRVMKITDLEMFIDFLQGEASTMVPGECNGCG